MTDTTPIVHGHLKDWLADHPLANGEQLAFYVKCPKPVNNRITRSTSDALKRAIKYHGTVHIVILRDTGHTLAGLPFVVHDDTPEEGSATKA